MPAATNRNTNAHAGRPIADALAHPKQHTVAHTTAQRYANRNLYARWPNRDANRNASHRNTDAKHQSNSEQPVLTPGRIAESLRESSFWLRFCGLMTSEAVHILRRVVSRSSGETDASVTAAGLSSI